MAVLGKETLSAKEIRHMITSERIVRDYRLMMSEKYKDNWAGFAKDFPKESNILMTALKCWQDYYGE